RHVVRVAPEGVVAQRHVRAVGSHPPPAAEAGLPPHVDAGGGQPVRHPLPPELGVAAAAGVGAHVDEQLDAGPAQQLDDGVLAERAVADRQQLDAAHVRIWPSPRTTYFSVVSWRRPIGPRACSFWVEMPISAPKPNCSPSTKRVEALTRTAAASTSVVKRSAARRSVVTMASLCPVP